MLFDRAHSFIGRMISVVLIVTTQNLALSFAYAGSRFDSAVQQGNQFATEMASKNSVPTINNNGEVMLNGEVLMTGKQLTGQQDTDYIPAATDTFGNDAATIIAGQNAQATYESKTFETATSSAEKAYLMVKNSFSTQKPDLTNDPMWANTDNVFDNIEEIAEDFANCTIQKQLVSTGESYHVPKYETCEKLPAIEDSYMIGHSYDVGIVRHNSGPLNLNSCGDGCTRIWIGTVGDNYWGGWCTIYEEQMSVEVIQPDKVTYAKLERSKFDDYHQVYLNDNLIYNGPNGEFPPEIGTRCELSRSWDVSPNIDITSAFTNLNANDVLNFKTRTSVAGNGEGFSSLLVYYNVTDLIYNEAWDNQENIDKAITIKQQIEDGFCTGSITCTQMPTVNEDGCTEINGVRVCESNFANNPASALGISPFCQSIQVESTCEFNTGELCWTNIDGEEYCFDNETQDRNTCEVFEASESCSYVGTACVDGAEGPSGACYVQEDTYDCGFDATTGTEVEEEVLVCDGQLQCVGSQCYQATSDAVNGDFGEVNAYLEMIKYAQADMTCEGVPEAPYDADSPPDQYTPISSCPDGYTYNADVDTCLEQVDCTYSENDFYSVDLREGIQVLVNNGVIAENASVTQCIPVESGGMAFTCGDAQLKQGTNTFYSVCSNNVADPVANSCPSSAHVLNSESSLCEVPPSASCDETKYNLVEGLDPFSLTDDVCESIRIPSETTCDDGYTMVGAMCQKEKVATATCPSGGVYDASTGLCSYTATTSSSCPSGYSWNGSTCVNTIQECRFSDYGGRWVANDSLARVWIFWDGQEVYYGNRLNPMPTTADQYTRGAFQYNLGYFSYYSVCKSSTFTASPICPSGYSWNGATCVKNVSYGASYVCDAGWTLDSSTNTCYAYTDSYQVCSADMVLTADETECVYNPETMIPDYSCPSAYPNWNEEEGRCESESLNPLTAVQNERSFYQKNKYIIDELLNPVGSILSGIVPMASADTQSVMNAYVADGFSAVSSDTGTENVTCSLFKGKRKNAKLRLAVSKTAAKLRLLQTWEITSS